MDREQILQRFESWLDVVLADEEPPRGVDASILDVLVPPDDEAASDSGSEYSLWAAMTALTQEVKLQGRAFKELDTTVNAQAVRIAEREREVARDAERRCRKEFLGVLIDLRDRMQRGLESVRDGESDASTSRPGWFARVVAPRPNPKENVIPALKRGYELSLERLDQTLEEFNARQISCQGQAFDPRRMNAVDRQESETLPEGTVIEVYRNGYEWNGEVFRPAQVKVSCAPAGKTL